MEMVFHLFQGTTIYIDVPRFAAAFHSGSGILFFWFPIRQHPIEVAKINREYRDLGTQEILDIKEDFVELPDRESYLIQVHRMAHPPRSNLERVLRVFSPVYQTTNGIHHPHFQVDTNNPLVKKMVGRFGRAFASKEIREKMDVEDDLDRIIEREMKKLAAEMESSWRTRTKSFFPNVGILKPFPNFV